MEVEEEEQQGPKQEPGVITVKDERGKEYFVNKEGVRTYRDLKNALEVEHHVRVGRSRYMSCQGTKVEDDDAIFEAQVVHIKTRTAHIVIQDSSQTTDLTVPLTATLDDVKAAFAAQEGENRALDRLSYRGQEIKDPDEPIFDELIGVQEGSTLTGRISVTVMDQEYDLEKRIDVYEFSSVGDVKNKFVEEARRVLHEGTSLSYKNTNLNDDETLYSLKVKDDDQFHYLSPEFQITIKYTDTHRFDENSADSSQVLTVSDHMSIAQVKERFVDEVKEPLQDDDKLIFNSVELLDDQKVMHCKLMQNSILYLRREDRSITFPYNCAECGNEVRLKKDDECYYCRDGGHLVECSWKLTKGGTKYRCPRVFHPECVQTTMMDLKFRKWYCPWHYCDHDPCGGAAVMGCSECSNSWCEKHVPLCYDRDWTRAEFQFQKDLAARLREERIHSDSEGDDDHDHDDDEKHNGGSQANGHGKYGQWKTAALQNPKQLPLSIVCRDCQGWLLDNGMGDTARNHRYNKELVKSL